MNSVKRYLFAKGGLWRKLVIRNCLKNSGGGSWYSDELRQLYKEYLDISVGRYSNGWESGNIDSPATIGSFVSIGPGVRRLALNHYMNGITTHPCYFNPLFGWTDKDFRTRTKIEIGNDVWIGANALILPNVKKIGNGAVIGAGSVVTKNVESYTIVAGNPARKIRDRLDAETAIRLQESHWWDLPTDKLKELSPYMKDPVEFLEHLNME